MSNFDFLGTNSPVAYGTNLSLVPVNNLQKYLKPVLQRLGTLPFPSRNELGFQVQKLIVTNLKVGKNFSPYPPFGFFHQNHSPSRYSNANTHHKINSPEMTPAPCFTKTQYKHYFQ